MRPLPFLIFIYLLLGLQLGLGDVFAWGAGGPDLVLMGVIFLGLRARTDTALLGAIVLGLGRDMIGALPPGLFAFAYGLFVLLVLRASRQLLPTAPAVHAGLALAGTILVQLLTLGLALLRADVATPQPSAALLSVVLTALLAPLALWIMGRFRKSFGFHKRSFDPR